MGKKRASAPPPPDPKAVAGAQTQANQQTAAYNQALNRGSTFTPLGSQTYSSRGNDPATGAPIYDQTVSLAPDQQQLLDQQTGQNRDVGALAQRLLGGAASSYGQPIDTSGLQPMYGEGDLLGARQQTQDALYQRAASYLDPQYQDRERGLETQLAGQGIVRGSEADENARQSFNRGRDFDYANARREAIIGGGDEMSRLYGMSADARSRGLGELLTLRDRPFDEFAAVSGQRDPVQLPQFGQAPDVGVAPTDITNPTYQSYQALLDMYNAQQSGNNSLLQGMFSLGGSLGGAAIGNRGGAVKP